MLTVPEALEVASSESDAQDDGDLLCDGQGEALGDGVPVREGARLPLGSPLEDRSEVLLTLTLVQPLTEPLFDAAKLTDEQKLAVAHAIRCAVLHERHNPPAPPREDR